MGNGQWAMGNGQWAMGNGSRYHYGLLIATDMGYDMGCYDMGYGMCYGSLPLWAIDRHHHGLLIATAMGYYCSMDY